MHWSRAEIDNIRMMKTITEQASSDQRYGFTIEQLRIAGS